ncbi:MAG: hypothetical protein IT370_04125 [Deltaproteobacteria bacterium]|nr:hypothetical protein [Deltaproteobacteria bacterium]
MRARRRNPRRDDRERSGLTAIDGANALIAIVVIVQMWLLKGSLDSYLAGDDVALPAAIASGILLLVCLLLYRFLRRIDRNIRKP